MDLDQLMHHAIHAARRGIQAGQTPFGCAIARGDELLAVCHNIVFSTIDITAHAEVTAIREACQTVQEIHLRDCVVATTCEPCPMCMAALHWARVQTVAFGATIADAAEAGFNELKIDAARLLREGGSSVVLQAGILSEDCKALFAQWKAQRGEPY